MPPLRERGNDVLLLASAFVAKVAQRLVRRIEPLSEEYKERLKSYSWPGNVRELQNVIERAVITSRDGSLNLNRALPEAGGDTLRDLKTRERIPKEVSERILQSRELQQLERKNILRALESTAWRIAGNDGAAALLGMNPSTLNSRIRAFKIARPK